MQENNQNQNLELNNKEIDLREVFYFLLKNKKIMSLVTTFFSIMAILYSLYLPNLYQSEAILSPVESSDDISEAFGDFSGLAGLAGISLGSSSNDNNASKAIEKMNSLSFFKYNLLPEIFLPNLMALRSWDAETNTLKFYENIYSESSGRWVRDFSFPQKQIPSPQESFERFQEKHLSIKEDNQTGFISVVIKHQSPYVAKKWVELLVNEINTFYREKDKKEAEIAIGFLNAQLAKTSLSEIKQALAELLKLEIQRLTLIEANESYVFEYIDPPDIMEEKVEPNRFLIFILGILLGGIMSSIVVLTRYLRSDFNTSQITSRKNIN